jgi:hypothetical protein
MNDKFLAMNLKKRVKAIESQRNPRTKDSTKLGKNNLLDWNRLKSVFLWNMLIHKEHTRILKSEQSKPEIAKAQNQ